MVAVFFSKTRSHSVVLRCPCCKNPVITAPTIDVRVGLLLAACFNICNILTPGRVLRCRGFLVISAVATHRCTHDIELEALELRRCSEGLITQCNLI